MELLGWRDDIRQLTLLSKDTERCCVVASGVLVDHSPPPLSTSLTSVASTSTLSFAVSDENLNLRVFTYEPNNIDTRGGQFLVSKANVHYGSMVLHFVPVNLHLFQPKIRPFLEQQRKILIEQRQQLVKQFPLHPPSPDFVESRLAEIQKKIKRTSLLFGGTDGSISLLLPMDETDYRRLDTLSNKLNTEIPHFAGLNPRAYRETKSESKLAKIYPSNRIVDSQLLNDFAHLNHDRQKQICHLIRTNIDLVLDAIIETETVTSLF